MVLVADDPYLPRFHRIAASLVPLAKLVFVGGFLLLML